MSARRRPSRRDDYGSVEDREREEPSTPIRKTSAVADRRKTKETAGGGKELEAGADEVTKTCVRCGKTDERVGTTTSEGRLEGLSANTCNTSNI